MTGFEGLYWLVFGACVLALLALERVGALQRARVPIEHRWTSNIALFLLGGVVTTLVLPVGIHTYAAQQPPGAMAQAGVPLAVQLIATFLLLDLWKYWEHRVFHGVPLLWRCHLVHHSDTNIDVTTSERHHPLEVVVGACVLLALIALLRPPAAGLGLYLLVATAVTLYAHANVRLPARLETVLCGVLVTPGVHAVHHSALQPQTDSNFGMVLTLWDRMFGTFVDPAGARVAHFGLDYFHRAPDTALWRVLQQPFRFRRNQAYPPREATVVAAPSHPAHHVPREQARALAFGLAALALLTLAASPTVLDMARAWRSSDSYQYAWLVVPMVVYMLVWHHDDGVRALGAQPSAWGIAIAGFGGLVWSAAALTSIDVGKQLAWVIAVQGVALATLGWPAYRRAFPTLSLLFFMIPVTDVLQPALRALTLDSIAALTSAMGIPHSVDGFVIHVGAYRYIVVDECSGLAYVALGAFLGYCFGLLLYDKWLRAAGMAMLGAALGVLSNVIRVNAIVLVDHLRGTQMDLASHGTLQWLGLIATLAGLLYGLTRGQPRAPTAARTRLDPVAAPPSAVGTLRVLTPVAAALAAVLVGALTVMHTHEPRATATAAPPTFADEIAGWRRVASMPWQPDTTGTTRFARATYARDDRTVELFLVTADRADVKPPQTLPYDQDASLWREKRVQREMACTSAHCIPVQHVTWLRERSDAVRDAYLAYAIDGTLTDSRFTARALQGWHRLTGDASPPALLAVRSDAPLATQDVARALRAAHSALRAPSASPD